MGLKNQKDQCIAETYKVPVRWVKTKSATRPITNSKPIYQLVKINSDHQLQSERAGSDYSHPKTAFCFFFFLFFTFFFYISSFNYPSIFWEMCRFVYRHLLCDKQPSSTSCSLYTTKPGHRFSLVHSTLPPFPCGTRWGKVLLPR